MTRYLGIYWGLCGLELIPSLVLSAPEEIFAPMTLAGMAVLVDVIADKTIPEPEPASSGCTRQRESTCTTS